MDINNTRSLTSKENRFPPNFLGILPHNMAKSQQSVYTKNSVFRQKFVNFYFKFFKGAGSATDFYNRNSRWTEGLLSAAKAVGLRAQTLTDVADLCVQGQGKGHNTTHVNKA